MLFYIRCPGCGRVISYDLDKYYKDMEEIASNPKLSKHEKDKLGLQLLNKYQFRNICCRSRIMGLIPYHKIIVT